MTIDMKPLQQTLEERVEQIKKGGAPKYHEKNKNKANCLFVTV